MESFFRDKNLTFQDEYWQKIPKLVQWIVDLSLTETPLRESQKEKIL